MEEELRLLIESFAPTARSVAWGVRPQRSNMPGISLSMISEITQRDFAGYDGGSMDRVQVDAWGDSYLSARTITRALVVALDSYHGVRGLVTFTGIFVDGGDSGYEDTPQGVIHRSRIDLLVLTTVG